MPQTLVVILCSALIAASSIQAAVAAEHHHARKASQHRNSNNEQPRDSNVSGTCGLFPAPASEAGDGEAVTPPACASGISRDIHRCQ